MQTITHEPAALRILPNQAASDYRYPILRLAEAIDGGNIAHARTLLSRLLANSAGDETSGGRLARVFAAALLARLTGDASGHGNLYAAAPGERDMLAAYQTLVRDTPFVRFGHTLANTTIAEAVGDAPAVHLVDLGIGEGVQWPGLFRLLASRPHGAPRIRMTGVDLPASGDDPLRRLHAVGARLWQCAAEFGIAFEFEAVATPIEELDFGRLAARSGEVLVVNAALALHHISPAVTADDDRRSRDGVLFRLRRLRPRVLTLVEPDAEHNALPFLPRVRQALAHYGAVFSALERLLPGNTPERETIEHAFFGREIVNVVAGEAAARVERHERHATWCRRLTAAGFEPLPLERGDAGIGDLARRGMPCFVGNAHDARTLYWNGTPLLTASAWTAR